jgi:CubicO group peptidase (beta-lactamase class C family)
VHDENAFALGGVSGHAGLFSTGADLARFARAYLNGGTLDGTRVFDAATIARFTRVQDSTISRRALGWETPHRRQLGGALPLAPRLRSHRLHRHLALDGSGARRLRHPADQPGEPDAPEHAIGGVRVALADAAMRALGATPVFPLGSTNPPAPVATPATPAPRPAALPPRP